MRKTMVYLDERQRTGLARFARRRGKSMAAVIREAVDRVLAEDTPATRSRFAASAAGPEGDDASEQAEALLQTYLRKRTP